MRSGFLGRGIGPNAFGGGAADWWAVAGQTCVAAYQPIGAASLAASYINLANPGTYDAAPGVAPTLGAGGWAFASAHWLDTGIVPASTWTMIVRFANAVPDGDRCVIGTYDATNTNDFSIWQTTAGKSYFINRSALMASLNVTAGILCIADKNAYIDGVSDGTIGGTASAPTSTIGIGANNNSVKYYFSGNVAAVAIYSTTLSAGDVAALTARMAALA